MVRVKKDLTGRVFGRLTVICQTEDYIQPNGKHRAMWLCQCACENKSIIFVRGDSLLNGHTKSCGCLDRELKSQRFKDKRIGNKNDLSGEFGILWASNTNEEIYFDLKDAEEILKYTWHVDGNGYASTSIDKKSIKMHQLIGCKWHDHKNRNKLDNRRENLRPCTHKENDRNKSIKSINKSGFIGVYWDKSRNKWAARIKLNYKGIFLGRFTNKEDAIKARLKAEKEYFGEFAPQKHLFEQYKIN